MTQIKAFDYEIIKVYHILVSATYQSGIKAYATVIINVQDANDNIPQIDTDPPFARITQNFPQNSLLTTIQVYDPDTNPAFLYSIVGGNEKGYFHIESNGQVKTVTCVTNPGLYELVLQVNDTFNPPAQKKFDVVVYALDDLSFKDQCGVVGCSKMFSSPRLYMFNQPLYSVIVKEDQNFPYELPQKISINSILKVNYSIISGADGIFSVHNNGTVRLLGFLDHELKTNYNLLIEAKFISNDGEVINSSVVYIVTVENVNDMPPVILSDTKTIIRVSEFNQVNDTVGCLKAFDLDSSILTFSLTGSVSSYPFRIDVNGTILISRPISAADSKSGYYNVSFEVSDGYYSSSGSIKVYIAVASSVPLLFSNPIYTSSVNDLSSPNGSILLTVQALDRSGAVIDIGASNKNIVYAIESGNVPFYIDPFSGEIKQNNTLEYLWKSSYDFIVSASYSGSNKTYAIVQIEIQQFKKYKSPISFRSAISIRVHELTLVGTPVFTVFDADIKDQLAYSLSASDYFNVDLLSGVVNVTKGLYLSSMSVHTLIYNITDLVGHVTSQTLIIYVQRLESSLSGCISFVDKRDEIILNESLTIPQLIGTFSASNGRFYSDIEYVLFPVRFRSNFQVNSINGNLHLIKSLDYENMTIYYLIISATDKLRGISSNKTLKISVLDVNEFAPKIIIPSDISVFINAKMNTYVTQIQGLDQDGSSSSSLQFTLQTNGSSSFIIDEMTGVIRTNAKLSGDTLDYSFEVCISDSNYRNCDTLTINVQFENNDAPSFGDYNAIPMFYFSDGKSGSTITTLKATDINNDTILYSLKVIPTYSPYFVVDMNGKVSLAKDISNNDYEIRVCANDGRFFTCVPIVVMVNSSILNRIPVFSKNDYVAEVVPQFNQSLLVTQVSSSNFPFYSIISGNDGGVFSIDKQGRIFMKVSQLFVIDKLYKIIVQATTSSFPTTISNVTVRILARGLSNFNESVGKVVGNTIAIKFSLQGVVQDEINYYLILAQKFRINESDFAANFDPVSWYVVQYTSVDLIYYRYIAAKINQSELTKLQTSKRKKREVYFLFHLLVFSCLLNREPSFINFWCCYFFHHTSLNSIYFYMLLFFTILL